MFCNICRSSDGNPLGCSAQRSKDFSAHFPVFSTSLHMQDLLASSSVTRHRLKKKKKKNCIFFLPYRHLKANSRRKWQHSLIHCCLFRIQTSCLTSPEEKGYLNESTKKRAGIIRLYFLICTALKEIIHPKNNIVIIYLPTRNDFLLWNTK